MSDDQLPPLFTQDFSYEAPSTRRHPLVTAVWLLLLGGLVVGAVGYWYVRLLDQPPAGFPVAEPIEIERGTQVRNIAAFLEQKQVVRSAALLYGVLLLWHEPADVKASTYLFDEPLTTREVAARLTEGDFGNDLVRLTHYEGERASQLASRAADLLPEFDPATFIALAEPDEGKLYPETYFIPVDFTAADLEALLLQTYEEQTADLDSLFASSSLSEAEVLVLASIVEREADTPDSMQMVAGILRNRLDIGMPLQADASIEYILDKPLAELTPDDLKIDSLYNTYTNTGLPPTPIGNPGLTAIKAVLQPTTSDYFYYITDSDGEFHYAKTYAEHQRNIARYLQ